MKRHQPALLGGLFIGVLSSVPLIKAGNICCCLWVICGGLLTVYLQQQNKQEPVETGEAVLGGLFAGVIGSVICLLAGYLEFMVIGSVINIGDQVRQALEDNPQMPAATRDMIVNLVSGKGVLLMAFLQLPVFAVFAMLGALLGLAFFRKKTPPMAQA